MDEKSGPSFSLKWDSNAENPLFIHEVLWKLPPTAAVLDLGCGTGTFRYRDFPFLIKAFDFVTPNSAIDFPSNVEFSQGHAWELPYPDNLFDLVVANFVFEHLHNFKRALEEVQRVCKDGGLFYVSIPNSASLEDRLYRLASRQHGHLQKYSFQSFLRHVYGLTGFKLLSFAEWPAGFSWMNGVRYWSRAYPVVQALIKATRTFFSKDLRLNSNFLFLFRLESTGKKGLRKVTHVCRKCGNGVTIDPQPVPAIFSWNCPICNTQNRYF